MNFCSIKQIAKAENLLIFANNGCCLNLTKVYGLLYNYIELQSYPTHIKYISYIHHIIVIYVPPIKKKKSNSILGLDDIKKNPSSIGQLVVLASLFGSQLVELPCMLQSRGYMFLLGTSHTSNTNICVISRKS